jgi:hypothetical protein
VLRDQAKQELRGSRASGASLRYRARSTSTNWLARTLGATGIRMLPGCRLRDLPDGGEVAWDGTVIPVLDADFRGRREVRLAELLAALADRLDPERLRAARQLALDVENVGPRAWLPARLMPYLDPADRRELLAPALVSALAFVGGELDRLDLVGDLMPFVQEELDRSADAVREFVRSRFPGHGPRIPARRDRTGRAQRCRP